jgi:hypothetical protein
MRGFGNACADGHCSLIALKELSSDLNSIAGIIPESITQQLIRGKVLIDFDENRKQSSLNHYPSIPLAIKKGADGPFLFSTGSFRPHLSPSC